MSIFTYSWHTSKFLLKRCQKHQTNIPRLGETGVQGGTHPPCPATCDLISSHPCRRWTQGVHLSQSGDGAGPDAGAWELGSQPWNSQGNRLDTWRQCFTETFKESSVGHVTAVTTSPQLDLPVKIRDPASWSSSLTFQGFQVERNQ